MRLAQLESKVAQLETRLAARKPWPCIVMVPPDKACTALWANGQRYERRPDEPLEVFVQRVRAENPSGFKGVSVISPFCQPT